MVWEFPAVSHTRFDFWKAKQYTQSGMWWFTLFFGVFGLHHYMLRSPQTGMIFFLTNMLLCGYPWFYDLIQLSSYGNTTEELNEFGLGHPWGPLGMAQGMWRKPGEKEYTENAVNAAGTSGTVVAAATEAALAAAVATSIHQQGGGDTGEEEEVPKDDYTPPNPWIFILYNLCVPISPLAHMIGGNRERAFTRFLYLFAGIIFAIVFTIVVGILWIFLPSSISNVLYSIYPSLLALVSFAYIFAVIYDYLVMFFVPSSLFFSSKECNLNGFVGFKEDPPCPSTQSPLSVVTTVIKPATDIVVPIFRFIYKGFVSIGNGIYSMTPMGRAEMMAKMALKRAGSIPGMPPGAGALLGSLSKQRGGGIGSDLDPLDYLGAGVIGAVLLGGFVLGIFRNVSRREYWLDDTPPNPRRV
jgi:hypothetical protein